MRNAFAIAGILTSIVLITLLVYSLQPSGSSIPKTPCDPDGEAMGVCGRYRTDYKERLVIVSLRSRSWPTTLQIEVRNGDTEHLRYQGALGSSHFATVEDSARGGVRRIRGLARSPTAPPSSLEDDERILVTLFYAMVDHRRVIPHDTLVRELDIRVSHPSLGIGDALRVPITRQADRVDAMNTPIDCQGVWEPRFGGPEGSRCFENKYTDVYRVIRNAQYGGEPCTYDEGMITTAPCM